MVAGVIREPARTSRPVGADYCPTVGERIKYNPLINIRPSQGIRSMELENATLRRLCRLTVALIAKRQL